MKKTFTTLGFVLISIAAHSQIVINEIYGGAGNAGSALKNDYIVLKNIGVNEASLSGATIQYAPGSGAFTQYHPLPDIRLAPGQSYLIQEAVGGSGTVELPAPDFTAPTGINFNKTPKSSIGIGITMILGKIVLASNSTQVTGPSGDNVLDFVGYGSGIDQYEGSGPAPSPTEAAAIKRISGDTNNNAADFVIGIADPISLTGKTLMVSEAASVRTGFIENAFITGNEITFTAEIENVKVFDEYGRVVKESSKKTATTLLDITGLPKGKYTVTGTINNDSVSQKIVRN